MPSDELTLPNKALAACIRFSLEIAEDAPITTAAAASLSSLDIEGYQVENLTGLENCVSLRELNLIDGQITVLAPIQHLTKLETLWLNGNTITDLTPLQHLTSIQHLGLDACANSRKPQDPNQTGPPCGFPESRLSSLSAWEQ